MKRKLVFGVAIVVAVTSTAAFAGAQDAEQQPARGPVNVTATLADVRTDRGLRSDVYLIWNRNQRPSPIGHGVLTCHLLGRSGILGNGVGSCFATFALPNGKIATQGIVHDNQQYTMVITGGTGIYRDNARGVLFSRPVGRGTQRLVFQMP